jgi:uncharacterized protein YkwD
MSFRRLPVPTAGLTAVALAVPAAAPAPVAATAQARPSQDRFERMVLQRVNALRRAHRVRPLRTDRALVRAADHHSRALLHADVISHRSPDGTPMANRVRRYVRARVVGETIAWASAGQPDAARQVVAWWMASPSHRAAIMSPRFGRVGVSRRFGVLGGARASVTTLNLASRR